jgi:hypothetical protein
LPKHETFKNAFLITLKSYLTNITTDFILNIEAGCIITFDTETKAPTTKDLYDAYVHANKISNEQAGIKATEVGINVDISVKDKEFKDIEKSLNESIARSLTYDPPK